LRLHSPAAIPLAAALAAGETPSPQMVAAAGSTEGIKPWLGLTLVVTALLGLVALMMLAEQIPSAKSHAARKPSDVLLARSQEIVQQLGFKETPADAAHGFFTDDDYLNYHSGTRQIANARQRLGSDRPATILFWYRQSPREMQSDNFFNSIGSGVITHGAAVQCNRHDQRIPGYPRPVAVFQTHSPERDPPSGPSPPPDWSSPVLCCGS